MKHFWLLVQGRASEWILWRWTRQRQRRCSRRMKQPGMVCVIRNRSVCRAGQMSDQHLATGCDQSHLTMHRPIGLTDYYRTISDGLTG